MRAAARNAYAHYARAHARSRSRSRTHPYARTHTLIRTRAHVYTRLVLLWMTGLMASREFYEYCTNRRDFECRYILHRTNWRDFECRKNTALHQEARSRMP